MESTCSLCGVKATGVYDRCENCSKDFCGLCVTPHGFCPECWEKEKLRKSQEEQ